MSRLNDCLNFVQRLIRTKSLPGQEGDIAKLVSEQMKALDYDDVSTDEAGNVIGCIRGRGAAPPVMFNTHLDHVDVGDPQKWPSPPYGAVRSEGRIWGRGAVDIKGPLAAQVFGASQLVSEDGPPPGDVFVSAVVQEEIGGLGARFLASHLQTPLVVIGEPSRNKLKRGHRGRSEFVLHVTGKSVHASVPEKGVNPLEVTASFISKLAGFKLRTHSDLGPASIAPTLIRTDQISPNVVPAEVWLTCDCRTVPGQDGQDIKPMLAELAKKSEISGSKTEIAIETYQQQSYTGYQASLPADSLPYYIEPDDPLLKAARRVLQESVDLAEEPSIWQFATDAGHFAAQGMTVVGFGPGEEFLAHTIQESIEIEALEYALRANLALARDWPASTSS